VPGCSQNLEYVFPLQSVSLICFHRKVSWCQPPVYKQLSHILQIFLSTQHKRFLNISSMFLNTVCHFLFMEILLVHETLQCCFLLWYNLWNRCKKHFVHVNQFHSKTTCISCLIQSDKIPIACLRLQHWQQWLCAIALVRTPTVYFPPSSRTCQTCIPVLPQEFYPNC